MYRQTSRVFQRSFLIVVSLFIFALAATGCSGAADQSIPTPANRARGESFVQVGRGTLSDAVFEGLSAQGADIARTGELSAITIDAETTVLIDGNWLEEKLEDPETTGFLANAMAAGMLVTVVDGLTSNLYVALESAGVIELPNEGDTVRNPAHTNPPIAGFKLSPRLDQRPRETNFASKSDSADQLVDALIDWAKGISRF